MCSRSEETHTDWSEDYLVHHCPLSDGIFLFIYLFFLAGESQSPMYFWVNPWRDEQYVALDSDVIGYLADLSSFHKLLSPRISRGSNPRSVYATPTKNMCNAHLCQMHGQRQLARLVCWTLIPPEAWSVFSSVGRENLQNLTWFL